MRKEKSLKYLLISIFFFFFRLTIKSLDEIIKEYALQKKKKKIEKIKKENWKRKEMNDADDSLKTQSLIIVSLSRFRVFVFSSAQQFKRKFSQESLYDEWMKKKKRYDSWVR